jgi:hypothetical protein
MSMLVLATAGDGMGCWARAHTVRNGFCRAQVCNDSTSDGPHCKVKFKG